MAIPDKSAPRAVISSMSTSDNSVSSFNTSPIVTKLPSALAGSVTTGGVVGVVVGGNTSAVTSSSAEEAGGVTTGAVVGRPKALSRKGCKCSTVPD
jgi:hypothetical protein